MPHKIITLTGLSTAADSVTCRISTTHLATGSNCSYPGSVHSGELLPVLSAVRDKIEWVNAMAYDAGLSYPYQIAVANYAAALGGNRSKVKLGLDFEGQWKSSAAHMQWKSPEAQWNNSTSNSINSLNSTDSFCETTGNLTDRSSWSKNLTNAGGTMFWGLAVTTTCYSYQAQINMITKCC